MDAADGRRRWTVQLPAAASGRPRVGWGLSTGSHPVGHGRSFYLGTGRRLLAYTTAPS